MPNGQRRRVVAMTLGSFLAFFILGLVDVLKGSTISAVLSDQQFSYTQGGFIVMSSYLGFVVATLAGGFLADRIGKKSILILAALFFLSGIASYAVAESYYLFLVAFFGVGFACGLDEIGSNYIILDIHRRRPALYVNLLTAFYGVGSMLAPLYTFYLFRLELGWREVYLYCLPAPFILLVFFLIAPYPRLAGSESHRLDYRELAKTAFTGGMCWLYVLCFAYVAVEVCIGTWLVEYLWVARGMPLQDGATWLAVYYGGILAGRLSGGFLVERVGYVKSLVITVALCTLCILTGIFGPSGLAFLLPGSGFFLSIILPTATALVSTLVQRNLGAVLGLFFCCIGLGGMVGPWLAGWVSDWLGLVAGLSTAVFFCLVMLFSLYKIRQALNRAATRH
ncbi:MAG: MFS transporter [Planctomycetota bacterium]|jgi:fucose permease|nr:MFS transporter [Planctomycetota bacterium]